MVQIRLGIEAKNEACCLCDINTRNLKFVL